MKSKALGVLRAFFASKLYPILLGTLVLISHIFAVEVLVAFLLVGFGILAFLLLDSTEYTVAPMVLFPYLLSREHSPSGSAQSDYLSRPITFVCMAILALAVIAAIVFFFIRGKKYKRIGISKNPEFSTLALFLLLLVFTSLISRGSTAKNVGFAFTEVAAIGVPFFMFAFGIPKQRERSALLETVSFSALVSCAVIIIELIYLFVTEEVIVGGVISKEKVMLGWGICNSVGGMLSMIIPLLFLGAACTRHTVLYFGAAVATYFAAVLTLSRNALLFGTLAFIASIAVCALFGEKKRLFRCALVVFAVVVLVLMIVFGSKIAHLIAEYAKHGFSDNGRFHLWRDSFLQFLKNPLFGIGFHGYEGDYHQVAAFMPPLPHNTIFALLGGGGIVLLIGYLFHRATTVLLFVRRPSIHKTLLAISVLTMLFGSLLDNFIFNFYPTFF